MRTYDPDKISISSFAAVKNIVSEKQVELYLHSPNQYIWENHKEYLQKVSWRKWILFNKLIPKLRKRDTKHRSYTSIFANSEYTKQTAIALYGSEFEKTKVKYPQLEKEFYQTDPVRSPKEYFIYVWRLTRLVKEVDTIIELFNQTWLPLIIMWSGPDEDYLKSLAWPTITFIWRVTEVSEKIKIIKYARWLVNLSKESCGIATMEALSLGVPVFGYDAWWTKELVGEESGILVSDKKLSTLKRSLLDFSQGAYSRNLIKETIQQKLLKSLEDRWTNPWSNI